MTSDARQRSFASLRGLALGDAFGSCFADPINRTALQEHSLLPGPWLWTDDTEMACSIVVVLGRYGRIEQDALAESFARHHDIYRRYGPGTNRILRLIREKGGDWRTLAPEARGGRGSWGNGAAMRVAPLGAYFADDLDAVVREAAASAQVTHTHREGVAGAIAVAVAAALAVSRPDLHGVALLEAVAERTPTGLVRDGILDARNMRDTETAAAALGNGQAVSASDTVPFCLWICAHFSEDFGEACWATAATGGDVDTTCAIVGGILAARLGIPGLPAEWLDRCEPLPSWAVSTGTG
ncbi:ADP-ribosylglycohydrolase family protein [Nocardia sp. NPDC051321]|uniref:ADP-ribosylglycohydrolase family protein n=1 Tax=Nocardia sp. NPDC051321 TaxID=3364323 RepID=UPI003787DFC6